MCGAVSTAGDGWDDVASMLMMSRHCYCCSSFTATVDGQTTFGQVEEQIIPVVVARSPLSPWWWCRPAK